jgi:hypothetical protein
VTRAASPIPPRGRAVSGGLSTKSRFGRMRKRFVERERVKWQRLAQLEGEPRSAVNVKIRDRLKRWETSEGVADSRESSRHFPG